MSSQENTPTEQHQEPAEATKPAEYEPTEVVDRPQEAKCEQLDSASSQQPPEEEKQTVQATSDKVDSPPVESAAAAATTEQPAPLSAQPPTETQEVTSSTKVDKKAPRRSSRSYGGGFQNYGLTYLPYKSNFEPSEDARRRADEFFKTLKL